MGDKPAYKAPRSSLHGVCGFSLLEMMAVVTFILLLASFAMPSFMTIVVRAHEAVLREDLFTMRSQIDRFTHDNERGPASLEEMVEKGYMGNIPIDPFTGSNQTWQEVTQGLIAWVLVKRLKSRSAVQSSWTPCSSHRAATRASCTAGPATRLALSVVRNSGQ
jgi:type II secretory pathway pseudopilin PulG